MAGKAASKNKRGPIEVRSKVWLEVDGQTVFGGGREMLLRAIDEHGSINTAARGMGITYRRAWGYVKAMEDRLGVKLVETRKGGVHGGGAQLTDAARQLLAEYGRFEQGIKQLVDRRFGEAFGFLRK